MILSLGRLLVYNEEPQPADVIIVLAGDRGQRTEKGVELWKQGYAPYIMVSGATVYHTTTIAELMKRHAMELGVPEAAIIVEPQADSTYDNAVYSKNLVVQYGMHSAIIVSSDSHMQRVRFIFDRIYSGTGVKLVYCAAPERNFDPRQWWRSGKGIVIVANEYMKFVGYLFVR